LWLALAGLLLVALVAAACNGDEETAYDSGDEQTPSEMNDGSLMEGDSEDELEMPTGGL
jgi:hypothetical protein